MGDDGVYSNLTDSETHPFEKLDLCLTFEA